MERQAEPMRPDIVAIGASAGGIEAASRLLAGLPRDFPASVLLVIHRAPDSASQLARVIGFKSALPVEIVQEGQRPRHGVCYVAPGDKHLTLIPDRRFHLLPDGFYRTNSIDVLFSSLARVAGRAVIGVVLSGALKDGTLGLKSIKEAGGVVMVQDPVEAAFPDMPRNAIAGDGPIDVIGPVDVLAREIRQRVGHANPVLI